MHSLTAQGVHVVIKYLLQMNQGALPGAILPMLQCGQRDGVKIGHERLAANGVTSFETP